MYKVELIRFHPSRAKQQFSFSAAAEATKVILEVGDEPSFIAIDNVTGNTSWGELLIWQSRGRALVQLNEHREHFASYSETSCIALEEVSFLDEDGKIFRVPLAHTISVESAKEALTYWLSTGQAISTLVWS